MSSQNQPNIPSQCKSSCWERYASLSMHNKYTKKDGVVFSVDCVHTCWVCLYISNASSTDGINQHTLNRMHFDQTMWRLNNRIWSYLGSLESGIAHTFCRCQHIIRNKKNNLEGSMNFGFRRLLVPLT